MPTPKMALSYLAPNQAGADVLFNALQNYFDTLSNLKILDDTLTTPPGSPAAGDAYLVMATGTGAWAGQDGKVAFYFGGWLFVPPWAGLRAWFVGHAAGSEHQVYDGSAWATIGAATFLSNATPVDGSAASTTTPQDLQTLPVAAGALNAAGRSLVARGAGWTGIGTTCTVTFEVMLGSLVLFTFTTASLTASIASPMPWNFELRAITVGTGASATLEVSTTFHYKQTNGAGQANVVQIDANNAVKSSVDLTASQTLKVRITFSANGTSSATNTSRQRMFTGLIG